MYTTLAQWNIIFVSAKHKTKYYVNNGRCIRKNVQMGKRKQQATLRPIRR
jgi:hypothetical protein